MNYSEVHDKVVSSIIGGDVDEALSVLLKYTASIGDFGSQNNVILIYGRYNDVRKDMIIGIEDNANKELNKIRHSILELSSSLKELAIDDEEEKEIIGGPYNFKLEGMDLDFYENFTGVASFWRSRDFYEGKYIDSEGNNVGEVLYESGYYSMWNRGRVGSVIISEKEFSIDERKDFIIVSKVMMKKNSRSRAGITWGSGDGDNFNAFYVYNTIMRGRVRKERNGRKEYELWNSERLKITNDKIREYELLIHHKGGKLVFVVNNVVVHICDRIPFVGNKIGMIVIGEGSVTFEYIGCVQL